MNKEWNILYDARNEHKNISKTILHNRGIVDADKFLHPTPDCLYPLDALKNVNKACSIILSSVKNKENILVYGDVDTDGCTSAAIVYRYIRSINGNVSCCVNNGKEHGVKEDIFNSKNLDGVSLIIIVDSINDSPEMYNKLLSIGIKIVILDHHIPSESVLDMADKICLVSSAIDYPNPQLSGAGVCWKTMKYIDSVIGTNFADDLVDLACVGIIADMCDVGQNSMENRYICYEGLNNLVNPAIKEIIGDYEFTAQSVSFSIAPLINCANRLENNEESLKIFLTDDYYKIQDIVSNLKSYKESQKELVDNIYSSVVKKQAEPQIKNNRKCLFFLVNNARNFLGLIATAACSDYLRPVIVVSQNENSYDGSMRAVGINDFRAIVNSTGLATCMGHESAAGVHIDACNIRPLCRKIEEILYDYEFKNVSNIDVQLNSEQITHNLIQEFKEINKITGTGFPQISVMVDDINQYHVSSISSGRHLSVKSDELTMLMWNFKDWDSIFDLGHLKVVGTLDENVFRGKTTKQLIMSDFICEKL